jgi:hypothetical protein
LPEIGLTFLGLVIAQRLNGRLLRTAAILRKVLARENNIVLAAVGRSGRAPIALAAIVVIAAVAITLWRCVFRRRKITSALSMVTAVTTAAATAVESPRTAMPPSARASVSAAAK